MPKVLTQKKVEAMFLLADIKVKKIHELTNKYWPNTETYFGLILRNTWFLVSTEYGNIILGPRKRVFALDWSDTDLKESLPITSGEEWMTSADTYVHSYNEDALLINIKRLGVALKELKQR